MVHPSELKKILSLDIILQHEKGDEKDTVAKKVEEQVFDIYITGFMGR